MENNRSTSMAADAEPAVDAVKVVVKLIVDMCMLLSVQRHRMTRALWLRFGNAEMRLFHRRGKVSCLRFSRNVALCHVRAIIEGLAHSCRATRTSAAHSYTGSVGLIVPMCYPS